MGILAAAIAVAAVVGSSELKHRSGFSSQTNLIAWIAVLVVLISGAVAVRLIASSLGRILTRRAILTAGAIVRLVATGLGYLIVLFAVFAVLGVSLAHLLIGAGLTGVILGIAAQQSLGNIFASLVLLFARPFNVGDHIRVRSGTLGVLDATVLGIGLTYVTVRTGDGVLKIPNSVMLASGIGQLATPSDPSGEAIGD